MVVVVVALMAVSAKVLLAVVVVVAVTFMCCVIPVLVNPRIVTDTGTFVEIPCMNAENHLVNRKNGIKTAACRWQANARRLWSSLHRKRQ